MLQKRHVAYYRVSTERQGRSGLGLLAQRSSVADYAATQGAALIHEVTEIESGGRSSRPGLAEALASCRVHHATLLIAKLDRLARNVAFVSNLMEAGVDFEAVDFPQANRLTIHILAAVAEHEAKLISERTKAALKAAKDRGVALGGFRGRSGTRDDCERARATRTAAANQRAADLLPTIERLKHNGTTTLARIATELNRREIPTYRGGRWSPAQVRRVLARARQAVTQPAAKSTLGQRRTV